MKKLSLLLALLFIIVVLTGCDDENGSSAYMVDISASNTNLRVGDGVVLYMDFYYSENKVFDDHDDVNVVVKLPNGVIYRNGTAELDGDRDDRSVDPQVTTCADGESYLFFPMDRYDLQYAKDPSGTANARLKLTVDGVLPVGVVFVEVTPSHQQIHYACGGQFYEEEGIGLKVE